MLYTSLYEKMIEQKNIENLGKIKKQQNKNIEMKNFLQHFSPELQEKINCILAQNCYIPQEIINAAKLNQWIKEKGIKKDGRIFTRF